MDDGQRPYYNQGNGIAGLAGGRQIRAAYRSDAPGQGLERSLVELLLAESLGESVLPEPLIVDGILGYVALQTGQLDLAKLNASLAELASGRERISLIDVLGGPTAASRAIYHQVATSFITFLIREYGLERFKWFAQQYHPYATDLMGEIAYGKRTSIIWREWLSSLGKSQLNVMGITGFLARALGYIRPYWPQALLILVGLTIGIAYTVLIPFSFKFLINSAIVPGDLGNLALILIILGSVFIVQSFATLGREYLAARVGAKVMTDMRLKMFTHLQHLSMNYYAKVPVGDVMSRLTADLQVIETALTRAIPMMVFLFLSAFVSLGLIFREQWLISLIIMGVLPFFFIGPRLFGPRASRASYERQRDNAKVTTTLQENLSGQPVVKAFGLQELAIANFQRDVDRLARSAVRLTFFGSLLGTSTTISGALVQLLGLGIASYMALRGDISLGAMVAFVSLLGNVVAPLQNMSTIISLTQQATGGMQRVDELLGERPQVEDPADAPPLPRHSKEIRLENASFSYTGEKLDLNNVSLAIPSGQHVAFVGPSGCGKSTILNLIMSFYDLNEGSVTIDGHDIRQVSERSLREQTGAVLQDTFLFNTTLRENIRMGRLEANDEEVAEAAKSAEIHDVIMSLPKGYDSMVGERGGRLSGGQRQRIAIARAVLRNPSILILDEATSALDPGTEAAINDTLEQLGQTRTVLSVTHRLSSVVKADRIFVLERGRLAEQGTHQELLQLNGVYHRLWEQQNGFIIGEGAQYVGVEATRLQGIPMFKNLDGVLLAALANRFVTERYADEETIFEEGDAGDKLYIVVRGQVDVVTTGPTGDERRLATLRDGDYFGEMALLEDVPRTATVRTRASTILLALEREQFFNLLNSIPDLRSVFEGVVEARRQANLAVSG